jgi:hypothetical protein
MKFALCLALTACVAPQGAPSSRGGVARADSAPLYALSTDGITQSRRRGTTRRANRPAGRSKKSMPPTDTTPAPTGGPVVDTPNRQEIDPGDIPPSQRPRNPNVDDRTKIPVEVSPDDMAPQPKKTSPPKKKRP